MTCIFQRKTTHDEPIHIARFQPFGGEHKKMKDKTALFFFLLLAAIPVLDSWWKPNAVSSIKPQFILRSAQLLATSLSARLPKSQQ